MTILETNAQLRSFLEGGIRASGSGKLGLEFEQFVLDSECQTVQYFGPGGVEEILQRLQKSTGWKPYSENGHLISLTAEDGRAITLEPGGQIEFGSTPCVDLDAMASEVAHYRGLLAGLREESGYCFLATGSHPRARPEDIRRLPKIRYDYLEPWLTQADELGLWMMKTTAGVQVNFDYFAEDDAMKKLRTVFALAPVFNAMFANSPIRAGKLSGYMSWRGHVWTKTDNGRCGIVEALTQEGTSFDDYIQWMLDVPMLFVYRDGAYVDKRGVSFRAWMEAGQATEADWELHLSTPFPEVRFRPQVELRSADTVPPQYALALSAFVEGLFYDEDALESAWQLTSSWSHAARLETWHNAHRSALAGATPEGHQLLDLARELLAMARPSAMAKPYLEPLEELLSDGRSLAQRTVQTIENNGGDVAAALGERCCAYR
ncbi:MAG: glutamate-cysteine ligase family protein [Planctomycetota bacterium]